MKCSIQLQWYILFPLIYSSTNSNDSAISILIQFELNVDNVFYNLLGDYYDAESMCVADEDKICWTEDYRRSDEDHRPVTVHQV